MESFAFRGAAGEVVRGFVRPRVLVTLVPVMVVSVAAGLASVVVADIVGSGVVAVLGLGLAVSSAVVGRFALAAREGDFEAGFVTARFDGRALGGFVARYVLLTLGWSVPVVAVSAVVASQLGPALLGGGIAGLVAAGPLALVVVVLAVVVALAPTLSLIVATSTDEVGEVLSLAPWRWLLVDRRSDLVPFYVTLLGGGVLFAVMAFAILIVVAVLSVAISARLAATLLGLAWVAPTAGMPILLGRLCGAFVASEGGRCDPDEGRRTTALPAPDLPPAAVMALAGVTPVTRATGEAPTSQKPRPSATEAQRLMEEQATTDLAGALADGERLLAAHPSHAGVAAALAGLYDRAGRADEARRTAAIAIERGLRGGAGTFARTIFVRFAAEREHLQLGSSELQQLGWSCLESRDLEQAAWCFDQATTRGADAKVEKGLVAVAEAMAAAGDAPGAVARFELFLTRHPESMLVNRARSALTRLSRGSGAQAPGEIG